MIVWATVHLGHLVTLYATETRLTALLTAGFLPSRTWSRTHAESLIICASLAALLTLYYLLYASNPGWLTTNSSVTQCGAGAGVCAFCGVPPSNRSHHSKNTGQCVHKFDHFCWLLSTDVGDANHRAFLVYLALEVGLLLWCTRAALVAALPCFAHPASALCASHGLVRHVTLLAAAASMTGSNVFFGYLLLLHTYLAASGQTTYEVIRGAGIPALAPYYAELGGGAASNSKGYKLPNRLLRLFADEATGRGPVKPYSRGVPGNLYSFMLTSQPRQYTLAPVRGDAALEMQSLV